MSTSNLQTKLDQIQRVFNLDDILKLQPDKEYIQKYYKANKIAYSLFHTYSDKMYMGISRDGVYKENDLLEAARTVEKYLEESSEHKVLELATGRGATSIYLAERHRNVEFYGIDLSQGQLDFSQRKAKKRINYHPILGDYHDLSHYSDGSMGVVFVIEALCYSEDKAQVLAEVKRVLKKNGVFIILDGYINKNRATMTKNESLACRLTEIGMAVNRFEDYPSLIAKAKKLGFRIETSEDVSKFILPTLRRFETLAQRFFKKPRAAKIIAKIFSPEFTNNAISGSLMPNFIEQDLASYYITVLRK